MTSATNRIAACTLITVAALFTAVLLRVAQLQHAPSADLEVFITDRARPIEVDSSRGVIYDRRGRLIASSTTGRRLFLDPLRFPADTEPAIQSLASATGYDADLLRERLLPRITENQRRRSTGQTLIRYVPVGETLPATRADAVAELNIPGTHLERRPIRSAQVSQTLAPLVGKVGFEATGLLGIEHIYNKDLTPTPGQARIVRDADGDPLWIEGGALKPPARGSNLHLSIDSEIQRIAEAVLRDGLEAADAAAGRLVMTDPATGEILAMLDLYRKVEHIPFDPANVPEPDDEWPRYDVIPPDPRRAIEPALARNRCVEDAYEPGSTFKPYIWSAAIERGLATPDEIIDTHKGRWRTSYGRPIEDVRARDKQSIFDVLVNSSNIGMVNLAERLTTAQLQDTIRKFGFGARTGLPLPGEAPGIVTPPERWNKYTTTSVAFGYEVAVTPVQIIRAFSAFARNNEYAGTLPRLTLLRQDHPENQILHRVIPAQVALTARQAMQQVADIMLERAHANDRLPPNIPAYPIFGKSGTALIPRPDGRGYFQSQYVSSFIAAAPADHPRIAVLVVIDDPGPERIKAKTHYGSAVAGPVAARALHETLEYLGVPHKPKPNPEQSSEQELF